MFKFSFYKVFYSNFLFPRYVAQTFCIPFFKIAFVVVRPNEKTNRGLIQHELCHVNQHFSSPVLNVFKYFLNSEYRYQCELEAYSIQLAISVPPNNDKFYVDYARIIARDYWLNIDVNTVVQELKILTEIERSRMHLAHANNEPYPNFTNLNLI
jgi:hypothetical protein